MILKLPNGFIDKLNDLTTHMQTFIITCKKNKLQEGCALQEKQMQQRKENKKKKKRKSKAKTQRKSHEIVIVGVSSCTVGIRFSFGLDK